MCSVEFPFSLIIDNAMRRNRHVRSQCNRVSTVPSRPDSVRRALFAEPVDHEETARVLAKEFSDLQKDAKNRWNYDFENDTPLQGRFEWQTVRTTRSHTTNLQPQPETAQPTTVQKTDSPTDRRPKPTARPTQRKLTDYMSQRKRSSSAMKSSQSPTPVKSRKTVTAAASSSGT